MLFYTVMKPLVQVALRVFFRKLEVRNPQRLQMPGPLLITGNHPNTLMDPLVVAVNRREPIAFLAKSTFFQNPILRRIMESGNSIPIYRRQDAETGEGGASPEEVAARNEASFGRCFDYLGQGGTVMIFPEGTSVSERKLRPLKTGAARIALGTEARYNFQLGLHVLPLGINYFDPTRFRSDVFINVGPPIRVADYAAAYQQDPVAAADLLTEEIRRRMEVRLVITRDAAEDALARQVERTFGDHLNPDDDPTTLYDNFQLSRTLQQAILYFEQHAPAHLTEVRRHLTTYLSQLHQFKLTDEALESGQQKKGTRFSRAATTAVRLILGLPLYLYGLINNYIPYIIPSLIARRATQDIAFLAPIMMVTGMLTFSLCYVAQTALVHHFTQDWRWTTLYALSLAPAGFFALNYWGNLASRVRRLRALQLFRRQRPAMEALLQQRATIMQLLNEARVAYLAAKTSQKGEATTG